MDPNTPWIVRPRPNPGAALRLLCFPFAGGGASVFRTWPEGLPANVEVWAIQLPGREGRFPEPPFQRLAPLVAALTDAVAPLLRGPFALYGHSLGAVVAFGFARELARRGLGAPAHLFASGRRAPHLPEPDPVHHLTDHIFNERIRSFGGTPPALFRERELLDLFLPILRADLAVSETAVIPLDAPLACPITALGGHADDRAPGEEVEAWRAWTSGPFERQMFPGGHFFLQSDQASVVGTIARRLSQIAAAP